MIKTGGFPQVNELRHPVEWEPCSAEQTAELIALRTRLLREDVDMLKPGDRVRWVVDEGDPEDMRAMRGTVREPTAEELAYVATWSPTARAGVKHHVIVAWDGDESWEGAGHHPDDLTPAEDRRR